MKKILSFTLLLCFLASAFALTVSANPVNLALDKPVDVSTSWSDADPFTLIDDDLDSLWVSDTDDTDGAWFMIDLKEPTQFDRMTFVERALAETYPKGRAEEWTIEVSDDKNTWREVAKGNYVATDPTSGEGASGYDVTPFNVDFASVTARYVKFTFVKVPSEAANVSMWEVMLYNINPVLESPVEPETEEVPEVVETPAEPAPVVSAVAPVTSDFTVILIGISIITLTGAAVIRKRICVK